MTIADIRRQAEQKMARSVEAFRNELAKIRTGRAHPGILDQVHVNYYGSMVPISQVANVTLLERPLHPASLVSAARAALRARQRQRLAARHFEDREKARAELRDLADTLEAKVEARTRELAAANDRLTADPARLQQVFWNLVRNAIKFTPEGGEITIRTSNPGGNGRLRVEVEDNGMGIPAETLPRVFDAFEQGEVRMTRQFGGLGLGWR